MAKISTLDHKELVESGSFFVPRNQPFSIEVPTPSGTIAVKVLFRTDENDPRRNAWDHKAVGDATAEITFINNTFGPLASGMAHMPLGTIGNHTVFATVLITLAAGYLYRVEYSFYVDAGT